MTLFMSSFIICTLQKKNNKKADIRFSPDIRMHLFYYLLIFS
jgi:hypothetical protein